MNLADLETRRRRLDAAFPPAHVRVVSCSRCGSRMTTDSPDDGGYPLCRPCVEDLIGEPPLPESD